MANIPEYIPRPGNNWTALARVQVKALERISYRIRTLQDISKGGPLPFQY